jgi:putative ABC transport system ATP-binding protein
MNVMFWNHKSNHANGGQPPANVPIIEIKKLSKIYEKEKVQVVALKDIDLIVQENDFMSIIGPSGSGKSTLMNIVGCLDTPSSGGYYFRGQYIADLDVDRLAEIRNRHIGFVFQNFNLLPNIPAYENVEMPLLFLGLPAKKRKERVHELFEQIGLSDRMNHRPAELSGGQMQRVAIARALACKPDIILADEPTGNLDSGSSHDIIGIFEQLWKAGHTIIVVTHDPYISRRTKKMIHLKDGMIVNGQGSSPESGRP